MRPSAAFGEQRQDALTELDPKSGTFQDESSAIVR
jgi:hypothetical protein